MDNRDFQIIKKILSEIAIIDELVEGFGLEEFLIDEKTKRAVCMTLINMGELVKNLSEEFRLGHKSVPWKAVAGLRDITAHRYQTLKMGDVWFTLQNEIPALKTKLSQIINNKM